MTTTTVHTTWALTFSSSSPDPRHDVLNALGEYAGDYDTDALTRAWVDALAAALPDALTLASNGEVYGPAGWTGNAAQALRDAVNGIDGTGGVDFWALAAQHDTTRS
jgi:hypothetical protein